MTDEARHLTGTNLAMSAPDRVEVSHTVDFQKRYPGETITLQTRLTVAQAVNDVTLRVTLPDGLTLVDYRTPAAFSDRAVYVEADEVAQYVVWSGRELPAGSRHYFDVCATVDPVLRSQTIESQAALTNADQETWVRAWAVVQVSAKGSYLRHLPELYEQDEFMGRFLMLFESFWAPINRQIFNIASYFDPDLTPAAFLPWLASWVGVALDENLSEDRQRRLIRSAVWLYRRRGTREALLSALELYTGGHAKVIEHRAHDFRLGPETRLGPGFALGTGNRPHTFTVMMELPPVAGNVKDRRAKKQLEKVRRQRIEAVIKAFKPAHTQYDLHLTFLS